MQRDDKGRFLEGHSDHWKGKHHSEETRRKMSEAHKGQKPWNRGKSLPSLSEETRMKISEALNGRTRSEEHCRNISQAHKGMKPSRETRRKLSEAKRGEKNHNWKGGNIPYYGPDWYRQKRLARERDNDICWNCGKKEDGQKHDVHHIVPFRQYGPERYEEANRLENLMTLCMRCHRKIEMITPECE